MCFFFSSRRRHTRCALVTGVQTCALPICGYPAAIRTDQGPEFTGRALDQWATANGVTLVLTQPGNPTQNAYVESFNGKFRDECLNENWSISLEHARAVIAIWRKDYNEVNRKSVVGKECVSRCRTRGWPDN